MTFAQIISATGSWAWIIFGLVLLVCEIFLPSTFLLWPGLAALVVGAVTLGLGLENSFWSWQVQMLIFLVLSLMIAWFGQNYMKRKNIGKNDLQDLNERGMQLIGQTATVSDAIINGRGRVYLGDTTWSVSGPDIAVGSKVRIISVDGSVLNVEML